MTAKTRPPLKNLHWASARQARKGAAAAAGGPSPTAAAALWSTAQCACILCACRAEALRGYL